MAKIKQIIEDILKSTDLIDAKEVFLSEVDFQLNLARCLQNTKEISGVILEYPFESIEIYDENSSYWDTYKKGNKQKTDKSYVDIKFTYKGIDYFVELKYKTAECKVERYAKEFILKKQGAQPNSRYQVYEDIERVENIVNKQNGREGFVLFITNDLNYQKVPTGQSKKFYFKNKSFTKNGNFEYKNHRRLDIKKSYKVEWQEWKKIESGTKNNLFYQLLIEISKDK